MVQKEGSSGPGWRRVKVVHGAPYAVEAVTLVPVARVVSMGRARGKVGSGDIAGRLGALSHVRPLAVLERRDGAERAIPIYDATAATVRAYLAGAVAILLFFVAMRWLARRVHRVAT